MDEQHKSIKFGCQEKKIPEVLNFGDDVMGLGSLCF